MNPYVAGYLLSIVAGAVVIWPAWKLLHKLAARVPKEPGDEPDYRPAKHLPWIPPTIGIIERAAFTTLIGWNVSGAASFIGAWITIKRMGGWGSWHKGTTYGRVAVCVR